MIRYLLTATMLLLPLTATADPAKDTTDWLHIGTTTSNTEVYARKVDLLAGRAHQTDARVWVKFDFARDRSVKAREGKTLYSVNCPRRTYRALSTTAYYHDGSNDTWVPEEGDRYVVPETNMANVVDILCYTPREGDGVEQTAEL